MAEITAHCKCGESTEQTTAHGCRSNVWDVTVGIGTLPLHRDTSENPTRMTWYHQYLYRLLMQFQRDKGEKQHGSGYVLLVYSTSQRQHGESSKVRHLSSRQSSVNSL